MNVNSLLQKIAQFDRLIQKSGFLRDLTEFQKAIQHTHNRNLPFMKDASGAILSFLQLLIDNDLDSELEKIIKTTAPFSAQDSINTLRELLENPSIDDTKYFTQFNSYLANTIKQITDNNNELTNLNKVLSSYASDYTSLEAEEERSLVSFVFKDTKSTGDLKHFARQLNKWNTSLRQYHQLLTSETPEDIELTCIQEGSIDVVVNINLDVALDLTKVVNYALYAFGAYLYYKIQNKEVEKSYQGNETLIKLEKAKDAALLKNIGDTVERKIKEQHEEKLKADPDISTVSADKKISEVSEMITSHIVKGNDIKLLTPPKEEFEDIDNETTEENISIAVEKKSALIKQRLESLDEGTKTLLLETYTKEEEESGGED